MPRLVLAVKGKSGNKAWIKPTVFSIIIVAILLLLAYLMNSDIGVNIEILGFGIWTFIFIIIGVISSLVVIGVLLKKFGIFAKLKNIFSSKDEFMKTLDKIESFDLDKKTLEWQKKLNRTKSGIEDLADKLPMKQVKDLLASDDAKNIVKASKDLLKNVNTENLGKGFEILKKGASIIKDNVMYNEENTFPRPEELMNSKQMSNNSFSEAYSLITNVQVEDSESNEIMEDFYMIKEPVKAPTSFVPQVNFLSTTKSKKWIKIIASFALFAIFGVIIYSIYYL